jgi:catechol 2,3-dioxygenase-like lactoylglutathione lyase family enzyme
MFASERTRRKYDLGAVPAVRIDHLVLTVRDLERTVAWYVAVCGMRHVRSADGRHALHVGEQKLNLHEQGREIEPYARHPTPGSADLCLIVDERPEALADRLEQLGVPVELGPVPRTGALGPMTSCYLRDPDGNLVELSVYDEPGRTIS